MKKPVLLYVEDEENDILFMERAFTLNKADLLLCTAPDGPSAIAYLGAEGKYTDRAQYPLPDVVLLDINLPGCSGFEVLKWLRSQPHLLSLPVVMFSSSARPEDKQKARALGANQFLEKPISGLNFVDVAGDFYRCWLERFAASSPGGLGNGCVPTGKDIPTGNLERRA
jgi:CheY-like chemotaxis protein